MKVSLEFHFDFGSPNASSVAKNNQIGALLNFLRAFLDDRFQMASLSGRYNLGLCPVVLQIRNQLSRSGGNDARTRV